MNWKLFTIASVSVLLSAFPQNITGCGGSEDPYDYYTTFFNKNITDLSGYRPFYYTSLLTFYDDWDAGENKKEEADNIIKEWAAYAGTTVRETDARDFIYKFPEEDIARLAGYISKKQPAQLSAALTANSMSSYFINSKNGEALEYIRLAKLTEKYCTAPDEWSAPEKADSLLMNGYIQKANDAYKKASTDFLKNKYAYLRCKLAFYNNRYTDCARWYAEGFPEQNNCAVKEAALSYAAGSLFRTGKGKEAAYAFSKAFSGSDKNKKKNFLGFLWATGNCNPGLINDYTSLCKNSGEKAVMTGMFALYGTQYELPVIQQVYSLNPKSPLVEILAIREINKLEEQFLTPQLYTEKGGKPFYFTWENSSQAESAKKPQLTATISFFEKLGNEKKVTHPGIFLAGAAYVAFMNRDYAKAKELVSQAGKTSPSREVNDQLQMITLLVQANESPALNEKTEAAILPSIQWLRKKAEKSEDYKIFYRNFFSQILAQRYQQQNDVYKAALAYGVADLNFAAGPASDYSFDQGIDFVRSGMNTDQLLKLYNLFINKTNTPFSNFLLTNASFKKDAVVDVIGTSYLRDFNFSKAIEWLQKAGNAESLTESYYNSLSEKEEQVNVNPFHDYLNDWQRYEKQVKVPYTKLTFAQKMQELEKSMASAATDDARSKIYYQLASAYYNMSFYGNSWMAVDYYRHSSEWYRGNYNTNWEKEYYGVFKAEKYYQKAYELATNKDFKAAALFLVAKCQQRQIPMPEYAYNDSWAEYDKKSRAFQKKFMHNPLFSTFKQEFEGTKFYQYAWNRCSYLRDFTGN